MINKDLNLFTAYKNGTVKIGKKSNRGAVAAILIFILIVAAAYSWIKVLDMNINDKIERANIKLKENAIIEAREKLKNDSKTLELYSIYDSALTQAKTSFEKTKLIDKPLLEKISSCVPNTVTIKTMKITPTNIQLSCTGTEKTDPDAFMQALVKTELFGSVVFDGVNREEDKNGVKYSFNMNCQYK